MLLCHSGSDEVGESLVDGDVLCVFQPWTWGAAALFYIALEHSYHFGYTDWIFGGEVVIFVRVLFEVEELNEGGLEEIGSRRFFAE